MKMIEVIKDFFNKKSIYWAANYPKAWSLGWLTQLIIGAIIYAITLVISFLIPMEAMDTPDILNWFGLGFIPAFFWWIFIGYRLVKYNSEKLFGNRSWWHNVIELPSYFIQLFMPVGIPIILGFVLILRVGNLVEDKKLEEYKTLLEEADPFFTFDFVSHYYEYTSFESYRYDLLDTNRYEFEAILNKYNYFKDDSTFLNDIYISPNKNFYNNNGRHINKSYERLTNRDRFYVDSLDRYQINMRDSIGRHLGVFRENRPLLYPQTFYRFSNYYYYNSNYQYKELGGDSLQQVYFYNHFRDKSFVKGKYNSLLFGMQNFGASIDTVFTADELMELYTNHIYNASDNNLLYAKVKMFSFLIKNYIDQIDYIQRCKIHSFYFSNELDFYYVLFSIIFSFTLILAIFKNTNWKEFLIGFFIVPLIPILSGIFMAILRMKEGEIFFVFWLEFLILMVWSFVEKRQKNRRKRGAVLLMIPHLLLAFVPIAILFTLDEIYHFWGWGYFDRYLVPYPIENDPDNMIYNYDYQEMRRVSISFVLFTGYFLYLVVLYPLWIKPDWIRFMAKPTKT